MLSGQVPAGRCEGCLSLLGFVEVHVWKEREKVIAARNPQAYLARTVNHAYVDVMRTRNVVELSRPARPDNLKPQETARVADALGDPWLRQLLKLMILDAWSLGPVPDEDWALDRFAAEKTRYLAGLGIELDGQDLSASVRADIDNVVAVAKASAGMRWLHEVLAVPKLLRRVEHAQSPSMWARVGTGEDEAASSQQVGAETDAAHQDLHQTALASVFFAELIDGSPAVDAVRIAATRLAPTADLSRLNPRMITDVAVGLLADHLTLHFGRESREWTPTEVQQELNLRFGDHATDAMTARRVSRIMRG
ncbi:hypothetical protein QX204_34265 (plasmid) [Nocardia sp. PE-7]|uniref:hypothetical protein n=1 Tax=Nocardia sp. PE-7 TaxID=3058426 RepID=UPI002657F83A|nr:hypothetical protein [Nocardia sp. PE-7]WKG13552.1 hypothetical protein QX204_34265 [Nocardia sp. PE-7]